MEEDKLRKFLNNKSSQKERKELLEWLDQPDAEKKLEEMLLKKWDNILSHAIQNKEQYHKLLEKIHHATIGEKKRKKAGQ